MTEARIRMIGIWIRNTDLKTEENVELRKQCMAEDLNKHGLGYINNSCTIKYLLQCCIIQSYSKTSQGKKRQSRALKKSLYFFG